MMTVGAQEQAAADAIEEAVARTGMSAERWMPPTSAAQAASVQEDPSCGCGAEVQEALSPPIPTHLPGQIVFRSEEHTSELQSLMRISYAVFCLKKKKKQLRPTIIATSQTLTQNNKYHNKSQLITKTH